MVKLAALEPSVSKRLEQDAEFCQATENHRAGQFYCLALFNSSATFMSCRTLPAAGTAPTEQSSRDALERSDSVWTNSRVRVTRHLDRHG